MGKGDKKTRRGKIIIGTYGVRRRRKKDARAKAEEIKEVIPAELKGKKPVREKKAAHGSKEAAEVKQIKKDAAEVKEVKEKAPHQVMEAKAGNEAGIILEETKADKTTVVKEAEIPEQKTEAKTARPVKDKKEEPKPKKEKTGKQAG